MSQQGSETIGDHGWRGRAGRGVYVVLELGLVLAAVLFSGSDLLFALAGGLGVVAAASGLGRTAGRVRLGWLLMTIGAGVLFLAGLSVGLTSMPERVIWSAVLLSSLVMYPLWFVGLLLIGTSLRELRIHHVLDAAVAVFAAFAVVWLLLLHPHFHAGGQIAIDTAAHVVGGFLVFGVAGAVAFARGVRRTQSWLLFAAVGVLLILANLVALALGDDGVVARAELVPIAVLWSVTLGLFGGVGLTVGPVPAQAGGPRTLTPIRAGIFVALGVLAPAVWLIGVLIENQRLVAAATVPVVADGALTFVLLSRLLVATRQAQQQSVELATQAKALRDAYAAEQNLRREITYRATHDELTGLLNRRVLTERLAEWLPKQTSETAPALLVLDLDGFKTVNDSFGHPAGDELLVIVADRLRKLVPAGSVVARLGGDEFAVLVPHSSEPEALSLANEICARVDEPCQVGSELVHVTASVGVLVIGDEPEARSWTPAQALRSADIAMYEAKRGGRNRYVQFRPPVDQRS